MQHEITHRLASRKHPLLGGLTEWKIQIIKWALRKYLLEGGGKDSDELLPYVAMGYKMAKQNPWATVLTFLCLARIQYFKAHYNHFKKRSWTHTLQLSVYKYFWTNEAWPSRG